jgi:hypothetical protein
VELVGALIVGDPARSRANRATGPQHTRLRIERDHRAAAPKHHMDSRGRIFDGAPGFVTDL